MPTLPPEPHLASVQGAGEAAALAGRPVERNMYIDRYRERERERERRGTSVRIILLGLCLFPVVHPGRQPCAIAIHVDILLAVQLDHDLFIERLARFFQQNPKDLRVQIFL
jgi:hypothetical protein